jgi:hypothetical protein
MADTPNIVSKSKATCFVAAFAGILSACGIVLIAYQRLHAPLAPGTLKELLALSDKDLGRVDIARMNLLCAEGLPNAGNNDIEQSLARIDGWAEAAKKAERKYLANYYKAPSKYENSIAKFKAVTLALTVKEDLKCGYSMGLVRSGAMKDMGSTRFFRDSRDLFIHGFIERGTGTCASIPVLLVALGRRCGYPLRLVSGKGHLFCRWEGKDEVFNIEASMQGVDIYPDSYYRSFPHPFTEVEREDEKYLKSHTPIEELGLFMNTRGNCLKENGMPREAADAYEVSLRGFADSKLTRAYISAVQRRR